MCTLAFIASNLSRSNENSRLRFIVLFRLYGRANETRLLCVGLEKMKNLSEPFAVRIYSDGARKAQL